MNGNHIEPVEPTAGGPPSGPPSGVASIADALREAARLAAVRDLLAEREQELRIWLSARAAAHTAAEGTAFNHPVKGLGRTYVTEPGVRLEPLDRAAFGAWALANHPGGARSRLAVAADRVDQWLNEPGADARDRAERLRALVDDPAAVEETVRISEALMRDLEAGCVPLEDGTVVDVETGEAVPVRAVPASAPTLVVRVDRQARRRFTAELRRRFQQLAQPALTGQAAGEERRAG